MIIIKTKTNTSKHVILNKKVLPKRMPSKPKLTQQPSNDEAMDAKSDEPMVDDTEAQPKSSWRDEDWKSREYDEAGSDLGLEIKVDICPMEAATIMAEAARRLLVVSTSANWQMVHPWSRSCH